jgi:hypothetical protein
MTDSLCAELHKIIHCGWRFYFRSGYSSVPENGIYIMFENGETAHNGDRIVRIGTHTGNKQLPSRIYQHFENENKNRSIFRKNIGRCFLNKNADPYLFIWNKDTTSRSDKERYSKLVNVEYEKNIEKEISIYIQTNLSFSIIEIPTKDERLCLEKQLIGTISFCEECKPSENWLGNYSPEERIRRSGLWQVQGLKADPINEKVLNSIKLRLIK